MQTNRPILFVEINDLNFIFAVGVYNRRYDLTIVEKIIAPIKGISKNKFTNIEEAAEEIKKNIEELENKTNYIFKEATIILENFDYLCTNISGYKKLNGSQLLKENISYILNSVKLAVGENEKQKSILHIFNSKSILDGKSIDNLPIGFFGDFYNHELSFFLIGNNDLKNVKQIFGKSNLEVKKIILKHFSEGTQLINQNKVETFFKIKINEDSSNIIFFDQASFKYSQYFNFGSNMIINDIAKICSLEKEIILNLLNIFQENQNFDDNELIEKKYFTTSNYRKIRKKLVIDIANARIKELAFIIFNENINIRSFKNHNSKMYVTIKDKLISNVFKKNFNFYLSNSGLQQIDFIDELDPISSIINTASLSTYGWKKEAIPITQIKNSVITRIFQSIFG